MNIRKISTKNLVRILVVLIVLIGGIFAKKTLTSYALLENSEAPSKLVTSTGNVMSDRVSLFDDLEGDETISLVPFYGTDDNGNKYTVYCLEKSKDFAPNQTVTKVDTPLDDGYTYIIKNGYPNKSLTGNNKNDNYLTQIAVWLYQDRSAGVSDTTNGVLTANQKSSIKKSNYYSVINNLVTEAMNAKSTTNITNPTFSVSSGTLSTDSDNTYLISNVMRITSNTDEFINYKVVASSSDILASDIEILDENNNVITTNSAIAKDKGFKIRVPLAKIKKASSINIDIINNYKDYKTYGYEPPEGMKDTMQKSFVSLLAANVTSKQISTSLNMPVGSITINKIDSTNNNLAGANFTIKRLATNEIVDSFTTTTTAHVTSNLLPGNYEITETAAPSGYYITDKTTNIAITSNDLNKTKTITNSQAEVAIRKIDSVSKQVVSGAVLKIVNNANQTVKTITTTNDYTKITGLSLGTYKVVEVTAPDGYIVNSKAKEFTLSSTNPKVTLDYADQQNETIIVKKDAKTNTILAGATLKVINKDTSEVIDTFVTTTTGHSIKGLKAGTYKVIEEAAPSGYTKSDASVEFTISNNQTEVQTVTFYNSTNQISITKVDADTNEVLANTKFNILNSNNQIVKTFTTTKEAYLLDKLAVGKYYLEEIEAPSGYVLNKEKVAFEVTATTKNLQVVFKNKKNRLKLGKIDATTKDYLAGAKMKLTDSDGKTVKEFTSESNLTTITGLKVGIYYLEEIEAPNGYIKNTTKNKIVITNTSDEVTSTIENKKIKVSLSKVDADTNKQIAGVLFELLDSSKNVIGTFTTTDTKTDISSLKALKEGDYYLREKSTKDGYVLDNSLHKFTINSSNYDFTITLKNKLNEVRLGKIDAKTKKYIKGATLKLSSVTYSDFEPVTFVSEENATSIKGLKVGKYILEEVKAPEGYVTSNSKIYFDVTSSGEVKTETIKNDILSISINNKKVTVNANKGYSFTIYNSDGTKVEELTIKDSSITSKELSNGNYYLKETKTPDSVVLNSNLVYFTIDDNKEMSINFTNDFTKVYISKKDMANSEEIEGASLTLTDKNGTVVKEWTSSKDPYYIERLPVGVYTLKEVVAPKEYVLNTSTVTFEVKETGDIQTATMFNTKPLEDVPNTSKKTGIFYTVGTIITLIGISILAIYFKKNKTLG